MQVNPSVIILRCLHIPINSYVINYEQPNPATRKVNSNKRKGSKLHEDENFCNGIDSKHYT